MNRRGIWLSVLTLLLVIWIAPCGLQAGEQETLPLQEKDALRKAFLWGNPGLVRGVTDFQRMTLSESIRVAAIYNQTLLNQRRDVLSSIENVRGVRNFFDLRGALALEHEHDVYTPKDYTDYEATTLSMNLIQEIDTGGNITLSPYLQESNVQNHHWSSGVRVDVRQPLLEGFGAEVATANLKMARLSLEQAENSLENTIRLLVVGVAADYYNLLRTDLILEERRQSLERSREQSRAVKIRRQEGQVADLDVLQAELKVAQNENQLLAAENDLETSRINFRLRLGLPSDTSVGIEPIEVAFATQEYSFSEMAEYALEHRLDIQNQFLQREQARLQVVRAKNQKLPSLDLSAGYDYRKGNSRFDNVWDLDQGRFHVAARFQIPLGDVSDTVRLRRAQYGMEQAEISLEQMEQQIVAEVDREVRRIRTLQNQVASLRKNVELAEESFRLSRLSFEIGGLISSFDLARAMDDLTAARTGYVSALIDYRIALANLDLVRGLELIPLIEAQALRAQAVVETTD